MFLDGGSPQAWASLGWESGWGQQKAGKLGPDTKTKKRTGISPCSLTKLVYRAFSTHNPTSTQGRGGPAAYRGRN